MDSVQVALRIRPLVNSEIEIGCKPCVHRIAKEPQVTVGKSNQMFTYNYVFDELEGQGKVYDMAVQSLIDNLFKGYNLTILAYGQTGSGKTFTMGTNYNGEGELGVIPRAVYDIFDRIESNTNQEFKLTASFIELYNESLYDLLTQRPREQSVVDMRDYGNGVCIPGLTEIEVTTPEETLARLREGSQGRVVGATAMNAQSSRSHAIFTLNIRIIPKENSSETMTSKFHLVDLAGSERSKKTGTSGSRFKEGVNINRGLLVLGNVISQLGEGNTGFINYRDSKLTRLLQDSLGGNSVTLMIACISPADYNQDETMSTLRYADRARKIKNRPIVNQDPRLVELIRLRKENEDMRLRLINEGKAFECPPEHKVFQIQLSDAQKKINQLTKALSEALMQNTNMFEKALLIENAETTLKEKLTELVTLSESIPAEENPILKELREKIHEVESEQKKVGNEILSFDKSAGGPGGGEKDDDLEDTDDEAANSGEISERRNEHVLSQSKINKELVELTKHLLWKEELVAKLSENTGQLHQMQGVSQASVDELKHQLAELQHEKEELLKQIRLNSNSQNTSAKIAEARRKKLQELESKVNSLMKKVHEQERIIKMKEKSDEKILSLKQEIMTMKQMKVRLIQQMKTENEKFKTFKTKVDREMCQLRTQNTKRQNQFKRMEQMHLSQQNVLRRKLEAAAAANKRIMAALERQKAARDKKNKGHSNEKMKERLIEEIELQESAYQAQKSLENLLQDRAALTKELAVIKESLDDKLISEEEKKKLRNDMKHLEQELEFRSAEISDLQQKLLDIHIDDRTLHHWDSLQSMSDAKFALSFLFNLISEKTKDILNKEWILSDLKDQRSEADQQLTEYQAKLENLESYHRKTLEKMEKDCEEKVYVFMKLASENIENSLEHPNSGKIAETLKMYLQDSEKLEILRKRNEELEEEISRLTNKGTEASSDPFKKFLEERMNGTFVLEKKDSVEDLISSEGDEYHDTPIHKRLCKLKDVKLGKRASNHENEKCDCSGVCETDCFCVKSSSPCNSNCTCDRIKCSVQKRPRSSSRLHVDLSLDSDKRPTSLRCKKYFEGFPETDNFN